MKIDIHGCLRSSLILLTLVAGIVPVFASAQEEQLPDSPGAVAARRLVEARLVQEQAPSPAQPAQTQAQPGQGQSHPAPAQSQPVQAQSQPIGAQKPVGTAVAESPTTTGVAASNPAGAAIAPARQRRVRTFLIKVGAIVGAGVAVGTVVALSSASPSRPPGSR